jgi:dynamin 1-like protein
MREIDEVVIRRQHIQETLEVLQQANKVFIVSLIFSFFYVLQSFDIRIFQTLEEFPLEAEKIEKGYSLSEHATSLPKIHRLSNDDPCGLFTSSPNHYDPHEASDIAI